MDFWSFIAGATVANSLFLMYMVYKHNQLVRFVSDFQGKTKTFSSSIFELVASNAKTLASAIEILDKNTQSLDKKVTIHNEALKVVVPRVFPGADVDE